MAGAIRRFSLEDCSRFRLQPIIRHLVWRKLTTIVTSRGGLGKSRAVVQAIIESALGRPIWACPELTPVGPPPKWLVVHGEDPKEMLSSVIRPPLQHYGLTEAPFLSLCADDLPSGDLTLTPSNIGLLVDLVREHDIDAVAVDTLISVLPDMKIIDPSAVRRWLRATIGQLQRETGVGVVLVAHEAASGNMVSGSLDWQNFARLVLQLEHKGTEGLTLSPGKENMGFPFARLRLDRDPDTLITTVTEANRIADLRSRKTGDANKMLTEAMLFKVLPLDEDRRTKSALEPTLFELVKDAGIKRAAVRDFISRRVEFRDVKRPRTWAQIAVGLHEELRQESNTAEPPPDTGDKEGDA